MIEPFPYELSTTWY